MEKYYKTVLAEAIDPDMLRNAGLNIVYTPLCGTGNEPVREVLGRLGANVNIVGCQELPDGDFEWVLGRHADADLILQAGDVSRRHAKLVRIGGALVLDDLGSSGGVWQDDNRVAGPTVLLAGDSFRIGPFILKVSDAVIVANENPVSVKPPLVEKPQSPLPIENVFSLPAEIADVFKDTGLLYTAESMALTRRLHEHILSEMNLSEDALNDAADDATRAKLEKCVDDTLRQFRHELPPRVPLPVFKRALMDELVGYGPLSPILRAPQISEIMVNGPDRIFVECKAKSQKVE